MVPGVLQGSREIQELLDDLVPLVTGVLLDLRV